MVPDNQEVDCGNSWTSSSLNQPGAALISVNGCHDAMI